MYATSKQKDFYQQQRVFIYHGYGAIGIKSWSGGGHVASILGASADGTSYSTLGGNQEDKVCAKDYPKGVWDTFVVPDNYLPHQGTLPIYSGEAEAAGSES